MDKLQFTTLLFEEANGPYEVAIPDFEGDPKFLLDPISPEDTERWREQFKMCPRCGGLGMLPTDKRLLNCPRCHGQDGQPSYSQLAVRQAILEEKVHGWTGFFVVSPATHETVEMAFQPDRIRRFANDPDAFWAIHRAAVGLFKQRREVEAGN